MPKTKPLLIFDGNLLLHKSHGVHGWLGIRKNGTRVKTGIPYGFLRTLVRLNGLYGPGCRNCVVFDASCLPKENVTAELPRGERRELFPDYKKNRGPLDKDIYTGKLLLDKFLAYINVTIAYSSYEYEGDDVVACVVKRYRRLCERKGKKGKAIIVSDDKDFNQLICSERNFAVVIHRRGDKVMTEAKFCKQFGFHPNRFVVYLSLIGDTNDDIPGIKGIGPKRATELVTNGFDAIEGNLCARDRGILRRNRKLIRLFDSKKVVARLDHYKFNKVKLNKRFSEYKMVSFLAEKDQQIFANMRRAGFLGGVK